MISLLCQLSRLLFPNSKESRSHPCMGETIYNLKKPNKPRKWRQKEIYNNGVYLDINLKILILSLSGIQYQAEVKRIVLESEWLNYQCAQLLSCVRLFVTPWTVARQAPLGSPWDFPGNNAEVGCHFLLQWIFPIQVSNPHLLWLLHSRQVLDFGKITKPLSVSLSSFVKGEKNPSYSDLMGQWN